MAMGEEMPQATKGSVGKYVVVVVTPRRVVVVHGGRWSSSKNTAGVFFEIQKPSQFWFRVSLLWGLRSFILLVLLPLAVGTLLLSSCKEPLEHP
jgi:hypothetical protein